MQDEARQEILKAFLLVMKPVARILLRFGITYKEFDEVAKTAFVDVATADFGIRGRPTNISRVAVMTGMTRKEVRRIRDNISSGSELVMVRAAPLMSLIRVWYTNEQFLDEDGRPKVLPFSGEDVSFEKLVRTNGGDIPPGAIRTELKRVGAVEELPGGELRLVKRTFVASDSHDNLLGTIVHCIHPLMVNVAHNVNPNRPGYSWPNKTAFSMTIGSKDVPRIRRIAEDRINAFAEAMDDVFSSYEVLRTESDESDQKVSIKIGAFYFEGPSSEGQAQ